MYAFGYAPCNADAFSQIQQELSANAKVLNLRLGTTGCLAGK